MHQALAFQHFDQRFQFQIAARRDGGLALGGLGLVVVPGLLICFGVGEGFADHILDAHAGGGIAADSVLTRPAVRVAGALRIFAEGELDAGLGAFEDHVVRVFAPAHFEHGAFAADGVGAAVQDVGGGDAARQRAVDGDVVGIENVFDADHGGHRDSCLR